MGILYERSAPALVAFSVALQLLALPAFAMAEKRSSEIRLA